MAPFEKRLVRKSYQMEGTECIFAEILLFSSFLQNFHKKLTMTLLITVQRLTIQRTISIDTSSTTTIAEELICIYGWKKKKISLKSKKINKKAKHDAQSRFPCHIIAITAQHLVKPFHQNRL